MEKKSKESKEMERLEHHEYNVTADSLMYIRIGGMQLMKPYTEEERRQIRETASEQQESKILLDYAFVSPLTQATIEVTTAVVADTKERLLDAACVCCVDLSQFECVLKENVKIIVASFSRYTESVPVWFPMAGGIIKPTFSRTVDFGILHQMDFRNVLISSNLLENLSRCWLTDIHLEGILTDASSTLILHPCVRRAFFNCVHLDAEGSVMPCEIVIPQHAVISRVDLRCSFLFRGEIVPSVIRTYKIRCDAPRKDALKSTLSKTTIDVFAMELSPLDLEEIGNAPQHPFFAFMKAVSINTIGIRGKSNVIRNGLEYNDYVASSYIVPSFDAKISFINIRFCPGIFKGILEEQKKDWTPRNNNNAECVLLNALHESGVQTLYIDEAASIILQLDANCFYLPDGAGYSIASIKTIFVACAYAYPSVYDGFEKPPPSKNASKPTFAELDWTNTYINLTPSINGSAKKNAGEQWVWHGSDVDLSVVDTIPCCHVQDEIGRAHV